jgi:phospholipase/lecithinase/hemolysin
MVSRRLLLRTLAFLLLASGFDSVRATEAWQALYVFGDSYSDSGAGYVDGNGPTAVAYLAQALGIPFTHAQDPARGAKSLNFAVSGAQTGSGEGRKIKDALLGRGMQEQVEDFVARVKSGAVRFNPEHTLFFLAGGLNDRRLPTETTVANLHALIRTLHAAGARHFSVAVLPTKIRAFSEVGLRLNPALRKIPGDVALPGATVRLSRWGEYFDAVMEAPDAYGLINVTDAGAGRALFNEDTTAKGDPETFYYYHAGHPSTAVHRAVGKMLVKELGESSVAR